MATPLRVLIVEDSVDDAELLLYELKRGGYQPEYEMVETSEDMAEALEGKSWDIIISDYVMPRFSGLNALKTAQEKAPNIPFIIVSGQIGEEIAVEAMRAGAKDYIMKGNLKKLVPTIERELREAAMRLEKKEAERKVLQAAKDWEMTFNAMPDAVSIHSLDFRVINANKSLCDLLHKSKEEIIGRKCYEIFHGSNAPLPFCPLKTSLLTKKTELAEVFEPHLNAWLVLATSPLFNDRGEIVSMVHVVNNITERKQREDKLKEQLDELQRFHKATVKRELRMHDIIEENKRLTVKISELEKLCTLKEQGKESQL